MKRFPLIVLLALLALSPALARSLGLITVTTAVTAQVTTPFQVAKGIPPTSATIQCKFTYGSGGTTADAWVQTSLDGSQTWTDIANCHFTTASARTVLNVSGNTAIAATVTATDGSLAANTAVSGVLGTFYRLKYTTVGTYAGGTVLAVDINGAQLTQ